MIKINDNIKSLLENSYVAFATCSTKSVPNCVFVADLKVINDNQILFTDNYFNKTRNNLEINKNICANTGLNEEIDTYVNSQLLRYQGVMSEITLNVLYTIAGIIIIIIVVSSIFVIRNSFSISVSEKNRQYGMLASIGATSKQIKKNLYIPILLHT